MISLKEWKQRCPYGKWTCADGREVLFNRGYSPILERRPGLPAQAADPREFVRYVKQEFYFDDYTAPWRTPPRKASEQSLTLCNSILTAWGFPPLSKPPHEDVQTGTEIRRKIRF
jgi:hypothetical protein